MKIYGTIHEGSDNLYVALINIDKYKGDAPIVFTEIIEDEEVPILLYEDMLELLDTWEPYSGKIETIEFGTFNRYGDFLTDDCSDNSSNYKKICEYLKGELKRVTYEKI